MFKKSVLQLLCWGSLSVCAQTPNKFSGFKAGADQVLKGISQYPVSSGILYNRVVPISGMGQKESESIPWDAARFTQAVHELEEASLNPVSSPVAKKLQALYSGASRKGDLQILAFRTPVHVLDTGRIEDSSLVLRNSTFQFRPKNQGSSPFREQLLSAASIMSFQPLVMGKPYRFLYPRNIMPQISAREILSARIRFDGSSWQNLLPGQPLLRSFQEPGSVTAEIEITWTEGQIQQYKSLLSISSEDACTSTDLFFRPDDCPDWFNNPEFQPSWPANPISATIPFEGITGKGEVLHYMGDGNPAVGQSPTYRNPIIFVDGVDFGDSRKGEVIYGKYLSYLPEPGAPQSIRLGHQLRSQGYDLVILNFPDGRDPANVSQGTANPGIDGGCDYIERNAMVLVHLIQVINQSLQTGSKKITIVGPSMGGLIARYALAYMEKNQAVTGSHKCGLFISQDAPHLGANIPVGLQQAIVNLSSFNAIGAEMTWENLNSPAAQELLINHAKNAENVQHNELRTQFLQNQNSNGLPGSLGWPQDPELRMVAISNGSLFGFNAQGNNNPVNFIQASGNLLSFKLEMKAKEFLAVAMAIFGGGFALPPLALLYSGSMNWKSFYAPSGNNTSTTFSFDFGFSLFEQGIDVFSEHRSWRAHDQFRSLDESPGGFSNSTEIMSDAIHEAMGNVGGLINLEVIADKFHSFIPLKSSLAFHWNSDGLRNVGENLSERNLVCTGEIPFEAYYCGISNEEHVRLNEKSVAFLYHQLNYTAPVGGVEYPAMISGPKAVSAGSRSQFTATYQGNLEFRTSWSISNASGVSASISNPFSQTCSVLVSSGTGQDFGNFTLTVTTEVKNLNGEWVCAGRKSQKVQVRKVAFMGMIQTMCDGDLAEGCSFFIYSGTPDYSNLGNGVTHSGYEWQLSRYDNTGFGSSCWSGALSISPSGTTILGAQKARITLGPGYGIGNIFTYYARARNLMQIPNPDYGQPGEPAQLTIEGVWKMIQLQTKELPGPGCLPCTGAAAVEPTDPIVGVDESVFLNLNETNFPAGYKVLDERGNLVMESKQTTSRNEISLKNLVPGPYKIHLNDAPEFKTLEFWLRPSDGQKLLASPSLIRRNSDKTIRFRILDEHFTEAGMGFYQAKIKNESNGTEISWTGQLQEFSRLVNEFPEGNYRLELCNGEETLDAGFTVLTESESTLKLQPNPAENQVWIEIPGFDSGLTPCTLKVKDKFGQTKLEQSVFESAFHLDISNLMPDLYLIEINRNGAPIHQWFLKN
jgi:hypothetical protein